MQRAAHLPNDGVQTRYLCRCCGNEYQWSKHHQSIRICPTCAPTREDRKRLDDYGLTASQWKQLVERCEMLCEICKVPVTCDRVLYRKGEAKLLNIDHDHETNCVRGILCSHCNMRLSDGKLEWLQAAIRYVQQPQLEYSDPQRYHPEFDPTEDD